jgi:hypothetical protein
MKIKAEFWPYFLDFSVFSVPSVDMGFQDGRYVVGMERKQYKTVPEVALK